jgi:hypothetical protein
MSRDGIKPMVDAMLGASSSSVYPVPSVVGLVALPAHSAPLANFCKIFLASPEISRNL